MFTFPVRQTADFIVGKGPVRGARAARPASGRGIRSSHKRTLFGTGTPLGSRCKLLFYNRFRDLFRLAFALRLSKVIAIQIFTV